MADNTWFAANHNYDRWFSQHPEALDEQKAILEIFEHGGYTLDTITGINTVQDIWTATWNLSIKAFNDKLPVSRHAMFSAKTAEDFAAKIVGNVGEYLEDAVINSKQHGKLVPSHWCRSIHRAEFGIPDAELGSPDRIILDENNDPHCLVQVKFLGPDTKLTANKHHLPNTYQWLAEDRHEHPSLSTAKTVGLFTNKEGPKKPKFTGGRIEWPELQDHLDVICLEQTSRQRFFNDLWTELYKCRDALALIKSNKEPARIPDDFQQERLTIPLNDLTGPAIVSGPCGVGKKVCQAYILPRKRSINLIMTGNRLVLASETFDDYRQDIGRFGCLFVMSKQHYHQEAHGDFGTQKHSANSQIIANDFFEYVKGNDQDPLYTFVLEQSLYKVIDALHILERGELIDPDTGEFYEWCSNSIKVKYWWNRIKSLLTDAIYDEAHNLVTGEPKNSAGDEDKRKTRYINDLPWLNEIFTRSTYWTATIRINGTKRDMHNVEMFGELKAMILPSEGIERGYIVAPWLVPMAITSKDMLELEDTNLEDSLDITYYIKCLEHAYAVCNDRGLPTRIILFVKDAKDQEEFKRVINEYFKDKGMIAQVVTCDTPYKERKEKFKKFANVDFSVLINYAIVHEGVNIESCTGVIIGRDMDDVKLVQAIGRAMRLLQKDRNKFGPNSSSPNKENYHKTCGLIYFLIDHSKASSESSYDGLKNLIFKLRKLTKDKDWFILTTGNLGRTIGKNDETVADSQPPAPASTVIVDDELKDKINVEIDNDLDRLQKQQEEDDEMRLRKLEIDSENWLDVLKIARKA